MASPSGHITKPRSFVAGVFHVWTWPCGHRNDPPTGAMARPGINPPATASRPSRPGFRRPPLDSPTYPLISPDCLTNAIRGIGMVLSNFETAIPYPSDMVLTPAFIFRSTRVSIFQVFSCLTENFFFFTEFFREPHHTTERPSRKIWPRHTYRFARVRQ